jgi:hypothetical protein
MKQCNQCGDCCTKHPCGIALSMLGDHRPCLALESDGDRFSCGLLKHAHKYISAAKKSEDEILSYVFARILGVGCGCCTDPEQIAIANKMKLIRGDRACRLRPRL